MKNNVGNEFVKKTQHQYLDESDQKKGIPQPPIEWAYDESKPLIDLVDKTDFNIPDVNLVKLIEERKSIRDYLDKPLTLMEFSFLLWSTQGVKKNLTKDTPTGKIHITFRTVPSGGARHPFETYLLINKVEGIKPGLYRYIATKHKLLEVDTSTEIKEKIVKACLNQEFIATSAATFIWVADSYRSKWRYSERGVRYLILDAGHVCQNLYLAAGAIESGVCAVGSYDDEEINKVLNLDGENTYVIYIGTVGKK